MFRSRLNKSNKPKVMSLIAITCNETRYREMHCMKIAKRLLILKNFANNSRNMKGLPLSIRPSRNVCWLFTFGATVMFPHSIRTFQSNSIIIQISFSTMASARLLLKWVISAILMQSSVQKDKCFGKENSTTTEHQFRPHNHNAFLFCTFILSLFPSFSQTTKWNEMN